MFINLAPARCQVNLTTNTTPFFIALAVEFEPEIPFSSHNNKQQTGLKNSIVF